MPDMFFRSASGPDQIRSLLSSLGSERVLWSGHCAVAEYAFEEPASLPRWTLPEETDVFVTETRVAFVDPATQAGGELHWPWPQHLRVQPGNRDTGRSATVTQIQLVCGGPAGTFPALVFAGGDLGTVADADRLANVMRQSIARFRVEYSADLGLSAPQSRMLSRLVIGPEFANHQGGEGQTVSLLGSIAVDQPVAPQQEWASEPFLDEYLPHAGYQPDEFEPHPYAAAGWADSSPASAARWSDDAPAYDRAAPAGWRGDAPVEWAGDAPAEVAGHNPAEWAGDAPAEVAGHNPAEWTRDQPAEWARDHRVGWVGDSPAGWDGEAAAYEPAGWDGGGPAYPPAAAAGRGDEPRAADVVTPEPVPAAEPEYPDLASRAANLAARVASLVSANAGLDQSLDRHDNEITTNLSTFLGGDARPRVGEPTPAGSGRAEMVRRTAARFAGNSARARSAARPATDDYTVRQRP